MINQYRKLILSNYFDVILSLFFIILGVYFRLDFFLEDRSLWYDTAAIAVNVVEKSYCELFSSLFWGQKAPIGFLLLTKFIGSFFNYNEYSLIIFPFVANVLSLIFLTIISFKLLPKYSKFLPIAFLSLSPTAIYYAAEFKPYSFDLLFVTLLIFSVLNISKYGWKLKWWGVYLLIGVSSFWFSFPSIILLTSTFIYLLFNELYKNHSNLDSVIIKKIILTGILFSVSVLINLIFTYNNPSSNVTGYFERIGGFIPNQYFTNESFIWHINTFTNLFKFPLGFPSFIPILILSFFIGLIKLFNDNKSVFLLFFVPFIIIYILALLKLYPIATSGIILSRVVLYTMPLFYILITKGLYSLLFREYKSIYLVVIIIVLFSSYNFSIGAQTRFNRRESRPLLSYYLINKQKEDKTVLSPYAYATFKYYTRNNQIEDYMVLGRKSKTSKIYIEELKELDGNGRTWVFFSHYKKDELEVCINYLNTIGEQIDQKESKRTRLYLYDL